MPLCVVAGPGSRHYAASVSSSVTAALSASRTSGPAPLAVFFDATGTTSSDGTVNTWRQVGYSFNFGDSEVNWSTTGNSKNVQRGGPLAAHVFESAGTYTVKVCARDSSGGSNDGDTDQTSIEITVTDPDTVYSGTSTVCLSISGTFTGAPEGATQSTISAWPTWQKIGRAHV